MDATQIIQKAVRAEISNALASTEIPIIKYGTVSATAGSGSIQAILDGDAEATPCVSCCSASISDRVVVIFHNNEALAISTIGRNCPFPVGAYLFDDGSITPPAVWAGTTWERILDRFPLAAGNTYAPGSTGGETTHTLSKTEIPQVSVWTPDSTLPTDNIGVSSVFNPGSSYGIWSKYIGYGQAHNNMPPYLAIPLWHRIA